jgi:DNA-directed RNA polymerase specialized sigma24 family protein
MRYFFGFTAEETAAVLGISKATVDREIRFTLGWLHQRLHPA